MKKSFITVSPDSGQNDNIVNIKKKGKKKTYERKID